MNHSLAGFVCCPGAGWYCQAVVLRSGGRYPDKEVNMCWAWEQAGRAVKESNNQFASVMQTEQSWSMKEVSKWLQREQVHPGTRGGHCIEQVRLVILKEYQDRRFVHLLVANDRTETCGKSQAYEGWGLMSWLWSARPPLNTTPKMTSLARRWSQKTHKTNTNGNLNRLGKNKWDKNTVHFVSLIFRKHLSLSGGQTRPTRARQQEDISAREMMRVRFIRC